MTVSRKGKGAAVTITASSGGGGGKRSGRQRRNGSHVGRFRKGYSKQLVAAGGTPADCVGDYVRSLVDPFEYSGCRLGWGCMVPSTIVQLYFRTVVSTSGADGSFAAALLPCATGGCLVWNTAIGTAGTTSQTNFTDTASVAAQCQEGRVISGGVRAYPLVAATATPGVCYTGALTPYNYTLLNALSVADLLAFPTSHMSIGNLGGSSTGRPIDVDSFSFQAAVVDTNGWISSTNANNVADVPFSIPYVVFTGYTAGISVAVEWCLNIEATAKFAHAASSLLPATSDDTQTVASQSGTTVESFWQKVKRILPPPGRAIEMAASLDAGAIGTALRTGIALWKGVKSQGRLSSQNMNYVSSGQRFAASSQYLLR